MKIATSATTDNNPSSVVTLYQRVRDELGNTPSLLILYFSVEHDIETIVDNLVQHAPDVPLHGASSCLGAMTHQGQCIENNQGLALCGIYDPMGQYGVGGAIIDDDPRRAAETALHQALEHADSLGQVPMMIWMSAAPGCEELLLEGINNIVGPDVPICGGSSADNSVAGEWRQLANHQLYSNAVVITAMFPSTEIVSAFHSGYEPTDKKGTITRIGPSTSQSDVPEEVSQSRILMEIDGKPAAQVYNGWTDGVIADYLNGGGNILNSTTLHPLGRIVGHVGQVPYYQLSHPETVTVEDGLTLFTDVAEGDKIILMSGTIDSLINRAGRVATTAMEIHSIEPEQVAGALVVYCAGCMLTVQNRLGDVVESFKNALPGIPFLGTFTFGEQGCLLNGENKHGNLMISVLLFTK